MIYTVTLNPSLDYFLSVEHFAIGKTNRSNEEVYRPGGKGINVSWVLHNLGLESTALGFLAGFTGQEIKRQMETTGIATDFIELPGGMSRLNVKLKQMDATEINASGPILSEKNLEELRKKLSALTRGDILILSGSLPGSVTTDIYKDLMEEVDGKGIPVIVDAVGDALLKTLPLHPFLIKPNHQELSELFDVELSTREQVIPYAGKLQEWGAQNVLVSLGGAGAVLLDQNGVVYESEVPRGKLINAVGAGDSMVAGFLAGYLEKQDFAHAFLMGMAAGSASAFSEGLADRATVEQLYQQLKKNS